jgi:hypothetical protein
MVLRRQQLQALDQMVRPVRQIGLAVAGAVREGQLLVLVVLAVLAGLLLVAVAVAHQSTDQTQVRVVRVALVVFVSTLGKELI